MAELMTRDFDLIRKLLFYFDAKPDYTYTPVPNMEPAHTEEHVTYHCLLMYQAGLLDAEAETTQTGRAIKVHPLGLTWEGHEFLDKIRNETAWQKVKIMALQKGGSLSYAVISEVLKRLAQGALG